MTPADLAAAAAVVLSWLLTYAIHSTILLVVAAVAAWRFADQHAWLDLIWKTALIGPLVTATLHFDPIALPLGGRWTMPSVTTVTGTAVPVDETLTTVAPRVERATLSPVVDRSAARDQAVPAAEARLTLWQWMVRWWPSLAAVSWLIIAIVAVARYGVRLRHVYRALGSGVPVTTTDLLDTIDGLRSSANQRHSIRLTTSSLCPVPLALGGRHIVLPERFFEELDPEQQRAALAHEVAHVARRDPQWRIAVEILEGVMFFQPLNRLARARLLDSAEFLCDEWAVRQTQSPLALARCLSVVASWWSPDDELPAGVSAMARSDSAMVRRVTRILNEPARIARGPRLYWLAIPVTLVADRRTARDGDTAAGHGGDARRGGRAQCRERREGRGAARAAARIDRCGDRRRPRAASRHSLASCRRLSRGALARRAGGRRQTATHRFLDRLHLLQPDARG